mmetsp:Transcript_20757/g.70254  ORF Transcript_20757/g.70254 Transcript_20757/m.70254 type:complete len:235 (-) Transcript_20757:828-1532(-)
MRHAKFAKLREERRPVVETERDGHCKRGLPTKQSACGRCHFARVEERLELGVARAEATPVVKDLVAILEHVKDDLTALRAQPARHRLARLTQPLCVCVDLVEEERWRGGWARERGRHRACAACRSVVGNQGLQIGHCCQATYAGVVLHRCWHAPYLGALELELAELGKALRKRGTEKASGICIDVDVAGRVIVLDQKHAVSPRRAAPCHRRPVATPESHLRIVVVIDQSDDQLC